MKKLSGLWVFRVIIKWLIPISFFVIASAEGKAYWLGGVMTLLVLALYFLKWQKIGDDKYLDSNTIY
jgi:Ca2+/H+ antiporter